MKIQTVVKQGAVIAHLEGELDIHATEYFRSVIDAAIETYHVTNLLLNMEGVSFIDSSGLGAILGRYKRLNMSGGKLVAVQVQPQVSRIFELSGLLKIIRTYRSESEALECI